MRKKVCALGAFGVFILSLAMPRHLEAQELVDHWTFDGHLDSDVSDNPGVFTGDVEPMYVEGFDDTEEGAIEFDGIDDAVTVNRTIQDEFTISVWVRTDVPQRNDGPNFWQGSGLVYADVAGEHSDFGMSINGDVVNFGIGVPGTLPVTGVTPVTTGEWVHLAAVREIDDGLGVSKLRVYVGGKPDGEIEHPNITPVDANSQITIGGNTIDTRMYTGQIDDVRLFDFPLTDAEIEEIAGRVEPCPAPGDPEFADTQCTGIDITGPPGGGVYQVTAEATDGTGDEVLYYFTAVSEAQTLSSGPSPRAEASFDLVVGTWTISVTVDDRATCDDEADEATCSEVVEIGPMLVDHWTFDGHLESEVSDNEGLFTGDVEPTYVEGFDAEDEGAISFDGVDDAVTMERTIQEEFTISVWVRTEVPQRNDGTNFWQGSGLVYADVAGEHSDFGLSINGDVINFGIGDPGTLPVTGITPVTTGDWVHLAAVREIDTDIGMSKLRVYVDGTLEGEIEHPNTAPVDANPQITIGGNTIDGRMYTGEIDDVRLYNFPMTEEEINDIIDQVPEPPVGDLFVRSDTNSDSNRDITDAVFVLDFLFAGGGDPPCKDAADANDDGGIDLTDGVYILTALFAGGMDPPPPYPDCGEDPTEDDLDCATSQPDCVGG